ncbi:hypothetical protein Tco_0413470 [Tanacetum coccineum]
MNLIATQQAALDNALICPIILNQDFVAPPSEEDLVTFIQELGYSGRCTSLETISAIEVLWEWRGIANLAFIQLGWVSRVDDGVLQGRSMGAKQGAGWFWYWREEIIQVGLWQREVEDD